MALLKKVSIKGYRSIKEMELELRSLNVLIGANGSGKSNLVSFFKMVNEMMEGRLQVYVGTTGGAEALLHYGSKQTAAIEVEFRFTSDHGQSAYSFRLVPAAGNSLIFDDEELKHLEISPALTQLFGSRSAHRESNLNVLYDLDNPKTDFDRSGEIIDSYLTHCRVFHFHDTSLLGPMRRDCLINANRALYPDAANLPAMLYLYRERYPTAYRRIVGAVKAVAPFFENFVLEPLRLNPQNIALHWRAKGSEYDFGPHQLSDGTLRAIALFTLLLQPEDDLPALIVLDEPELGLHPYALEIVAGLIRAASLKTQVIVATQSQTFLEHFEPSEIVVVDSREGSSHFRRLDAEPLKDWLADYSIGELWQKNVLGGGPLP